MDDVREGLLGRRARAVREATERAVVGVPAQRRTSPVGDSEAALVHLTAAADALARFVAGVGAAAAATPQHQGCRTAGRPSCPACRALDDATEVARHLVVLLARAREEVRREPVEDRQTGAPGSGRVERDWTRW